METEIAQRIQQYSEDGNFRELGLFVKFGEKNPDLATVLTGFYSKLREYATLKKMDNEPCLSVDMEKSLGRLCVGDGQEEE